MLYTSIMLYYITLLHSLLLLLLLIVIVITSLSLYIYIYTHVYLILQDVAEPVQTLTLIS